MLKALTVLIVIIAISSSAQAAEPANFNKACDEIKHHNCQHARELLAQLAAKGDAKSQVLLGMLYEKGAGVKKDAKQAEEWFKKAAAHGELEGQTLLGMLMLKGPDVQKRHDQAVRNLHLAADRGYDKARRSLESMPNGERIESAFAAQQQRAQARHTNTLQGKSNIKESWKGYSALAKAMDEVASSAASAQ
ncbi:MAG: tetratricopeptide repeat protein [Candidatus Obscuribacterales bacterium]